MMFQSAPCRFFVLLSLAGTLAGLEVLQAQTASATLQGTITDPAGGVVPGAEVTAELVATGFKRQAVSDDTGTYFLNFLPVGNYTLTVELPGFKTAQRSNVVLEIGQVRTVDFRLEVGELLEIVEVTDVAPPLDRASPVIGTVIQSKQISQLPLNGRHWASLMMLAPGAINTGSGDQRTIRFVGRARDDNNWTFDGVDATGVKDPRQETGIRLIISMDSISEFRVSSMLYSAESGSGAGGQVQLISRGGTNQFRGTLYNYLRNDLFDARVFVDPEDLPPFRLNQFGGNLGGPLVKDRTFFFFNYEGLRQHQGQTFISSVPSASFRSRVLATSPSLAPVINAYPLGTRPTSDPDIDQLVRERTHVQREDAVVVRIDHQFSDKTTAYGRFSLDDAVVEMPQDPGIGLRTDLVRPSNAVFQVQRLFSPSVIHQTKIGMNRSPLRRLDSGPLREQVSVPGFMTLFRDGREIVEAGTSYSLLTDLAVTRGRHNLKMGGEVRRIHVNVGEGEPVSLSYSSRSNFVNNRLESFSINPFPVRGGRRWYSFGYVQDDIKLRPNLHFNVGLRYEYYSVVSEVKDRARVFDLACGGFCPEGTPFYQPDRNNFAPRLGLAWSPGIFKNRTVIRAGYGVFFGPGQNDDVFAAIDSSADRISLTRVEAPALSYPIDPFIALAQTIGATPRALQRDRRDLYSLGYSLSIQQQLPGSLVMQVGYAGNQGHKLFARTFINVIDPSTGRRPLPQFGRIDMKANWGNSTFHGLQVSLHRQFVQGFLLGAQYMWSHSINDGSVGGGEAGGPQNVNNRQADRGNSSQDIRHTLTTNWILELPFGRGRRFLNQGGFLSVLLGNWSFSGLTQARTGLPLNITVSRSSRDLPDGNTTDQRPDRVPGVPLEPPGGKSPARWINPEAFAVPPAGRWGNAGRNIARGPNLIQFDVALQRQFPLSETKNVEFRAEAFNVFNRAQLGNPRTNFSDSVRFGVIESPFNRLFGTGTNRQMQFMLRLNF